MSIPFFYDYFKPLFEAVAMFIHQRELVLSGGWVQRHLMEGFRNAEIRIVEVPIYRCVWQGMGEFEDCPGAFPIEVGGYEDPCLP